MGDSIKVLQNSKRDRSFLKSGNQQPPQAFTQLIEYSIET